MTNVAWSLRSAVGLLGDSKALPLLLLSLCLSKIFRAGLYELSLLVGFVDRNLTFIPRRRRLADGSVRPTRALASPERGGHRQLPGFARPGRVRAPVPTRAGLDFG